MPSTREAYFRFYGRLNDLLPATDIQTEIRYSFGGRPTLKDAIEGQGIPHPEVDLILRNGTPASFGTVLRAGDRVSVYPWLHRLIPPGETLRPALPDPLRFVCDVHLGTLARRLRMLGFDTTYSPECTDETLARIASEEHRVLLTRDRELLKRGRVRLGTYVRAQDPDRQLRALVERVRIDAEDLRPFSRCLECNTELRDAPPAAVAAAVPPHARRMNDEFWRCPDCESVYWEGDHVRRMRRQIRRLFGDVDL